MTPHPQPIYAMTLLALSGSMQYGSTSTGLLGAARVLAPRDIDVVDVPPLHTFPAWPPAQQEPLAIPGAVVALQRRVAQADGLLIASPYGRGVPRVLLATVHWLGQTGALRGTPVAVLNHTPHAMTAHETLCASVRATGAVLIEDSALTIPLTPPGQRVTDILVEPATSALVERAVVVIVDAIRRLRDASDTAER